MEYLLYALPAVLGLLAGAALWNIYIRKLESQNLHSAEVRARELISQAEKNAENILKESELKAKDEFFKRREEFNREAEQTRNEQKDQERRLEKKEDLLEQQSQNLLKKEKHLQHTEKKLHERREHLELKVKEAETLVAQETAKLHEITGMSRDEAEKLLLERLDRELADEVASRIQKNEEQIKVVSEERARRILATAIHRYA
ncbi:MAG TPA: Rnase Y domain-containing protein, partial [Gemmataceae bacterium]|nr:Rnase Y domain-containing protein [Gemmataceae bacterium]